MDDVCKICGGFGWVNSRADDGKVIYNRPARCVCKIAEDKAKRDAALIEFCKLPVNTDRFTFANYKAGNNPTLKAAQNAAMELAEEVGTIKWLALTGPADMGKTHLAVAICRRWLERGRPAKFYFSSILLKELKDGFELDGEQSYRQRFDALCRVPLLVLDDLGVENPTAFAREHIQTIIDYRYFNQLPLVITTNKPVNDLGPIDPEHRIASRLQREEWCVVIRTEGQEHRFRRAK